MTCSAIHTTVPNPNVLISFEPEDRGSFVLKILKAQVINIRNLMDKVIQREAVIHSERVQTYPGTIVRLH